jgi:UDP-glucose 4-epimerase
MRVLVTGSSGQVGSAIAGLLAEHHEIVGLDSVPGQYTTHLGSVVDEALVSAAVSRVNAIVHTASLHAPDLTRAPSEAFVSINVLGTSNLLEAAAKRGIERFIYSSTTSIYGRALVPGDRAVWVTESLEPQPRDIYDQTKLKAEALCREATLRGMVSCISLRFSRCFPEPEHLVAAYRLHRGVDIRDVAEAHRLALASSITCFEVFNISARSPFSPDHCPQLLKDPQGLIRSRFPEIHETFANKGWPQPQSIDRVYAIEKAESQLGYRPRYNFLEYALGLSVPL